MPRDDSGRRPAFRATSAITDFATVHKPEDAEAPILARPVRQAVHQWLLELGAADELAAVGLKARKTAIYAGPPGTGKTTLAHHMAARMGLPLVLVNMAALRSQWVGETGRNVLALFRAIQEQGDSCVLFLDEFDAIAGARTQGRQGSEKEANAIVISLLQMFDQHEGVIIAATNRGDIIDPALWRRFGMHLDVGFPDPECRFAIIRRYLQPFALPDEAIDDLTEATEGATPALLRQLMEGVKRALVLSPRINEPTDAATVFGRLIVSVQPAPDTPMPPLWSERWARDRVEALPWPPVREGQS